MAVVNPPGQRSPLVDRMLRLESIKRRSQCRSVNELLLVRCHHVRESRSGRFPLSGWQQISVTQVSSVIAAGDRCYVE